MKALVAVNVSKAMEAYKALVVSVENALSLKIQSELLEYEKTRTEAGYEIEILLNAFLSSSAANIVTASTEGALKQFEKDIGSVVGQNVSLTTTQSTSGDLMQLRRSLKSVADKIRAESKDILRRAANEKHTSGKVSFAKPQVNSVIADSMGRKWSGLSFMETMFKKYAIDAYVNAYATLTTEQGHDTIEVVYEDYTHRNHGLKLSVTGKRGLPALFEKRKDVFHPNTQANLKVVANVG